MISTLSSQLVNAVQYTATFNTCADIHSLPLLFTTGTYNIRSSEGSIDQTTKIALL